MPRPSSRSAFRLRALSARLVAFFAAALVALALTPSFAVGDDDDDYGATVSKRSEDKPPRGRGHSGPGSGLPTVEPVETPTVEVPTVTPAPTEVPTVAPTPTQAPKESTEEVAPRPTPTQSAPQLPRSTPQAPSATPDRTPEPRDADSGSVGVGVSPGSGGSPPSASTPEASRGTGSAPAPTGSARVRRPAAPRQTGGLVDLADRSTGRRGRTTPAGGGSSGGGGAVSYREDSAGRRVYSVPTADGASRREVSVPGGVFGVLPAAAIEAKAEVAGAIEERRARKGAPSEAPTDAARPTAVTETLSEPLEAIEEATGGRVPPVLVLTVLAAMTAALVFGIRREMQRW